MSKKEKEMKPHFKEIAKYELFVGNLSKGAEKELKKLDGYRYFQPNRDGQPYGFVGFSSQEETDAAMELLTGKEINGRIIEVKRPNSYKPEKINTKKELKAKQQLELEKWEREEKEREQEEANKKLLAEQKAELEYYQSIQGLVHSSKPTDNSTHEHLRTSKPILKSTVLNPEENTSDLSQFADTYIEWNGSQVESSAFAPAINYTSPVSLLFPNCQKTAIELQELEQRQDFFHQQELLRIQKIEEEKKQMIEYQSYQIDIDRYKEAIDQANKIIQELERKKYEFEQLQEKKRQEEIHQRM
ncbi:MAG: hypothetical protein EBU93_07980, partial [Chlamydiae bacterium]|nr:hypothetical protein [Chlamydiota bacterium]